jgi:hypothetical protein
MAAIKAEFDKTHDNDLIKMIRSDCSGEFEDLLVALVADRAEYDAILLKEACDGFGTNEAVVSEILCTRTQMEISDAADAYERLFGKTLLSRLQDETSGYLKTIYETLLRRAQGVAGFKRFEKEEKAKEAAAAAAAAEENQRRIDPSDGGNYTKAEFVAQYGDTQIWDTCKVYVDPAAAEAAKAKAAGIPQDPAEAARASFAAAEKARVKKRDDPMDIDADIDMLYNAGEGKWGTDEGAFVEKLCTSTPEYREKIYAAYRKKYGKGLDVVIMDEMTGDYANWHSSSRRFRGWSPSASDGACPRRHDSGAVWALSVAGRGEWRGEGRWGRGVRAAREHRACCSEVNFTRK